MKELRLVFALATVGFIAGVAIVASFQATKETIRKNKEEALQAAVFRVVPGAAKIEPWVAPDGRTYFVCYDASGEVAGVAIEASGQGFQDTIRILYGYSPKENAIVGMEVLESKETPGLGDKIANDPQFQSNFDRLVVDREVVLVKHGEKKNPWEIEAITGATVSSRAITNLLRESLARVLPLLRERFRP